MMVGMSTKNSHEFPGIFSITPKPSFFFILFFIFFHFFLFASVAFWALLQKRLIKGSTNTIFQLIWETLFPFQLVPFFLVFFSLSFCQPVRPELEDIGSRSTPPFPSPNTTFFLLSLSLFPIITITSCLLLISKTP